MLKLFILSFLLVSACFTQAQDDQFYSIENLGDQYSKEFIENAIENASMCGFFYTDSRRKMIFDDGAVVELYSSEDLANLSESCFVSESPAHKDEYWKIAANGHIIRFKQTYGK